MAAETFAAEKRIGSGAMGQVWLGRHVRSGTPVAIKLVLPQHLDTVIGNEAVRTEARAVAGLAHPNVVWMYDQGEATRELAAQTGVPVGTPYLVMEHLSGGDLAARHRRDPSWERIRADLVAMLEALAHCHARGVIHRDLKPGNVLFGTHADARTGLKITDFGISATSDSASRAVGTPQYCAPEQHGDCAPVGPWTDMFAVGVLTWRLLTGSAPFKRWRGVGLYLAKLDEHLPELVPRCQVPEGIEDWLRACMAGAAGARFQCAPDALYALERLGRPEGSFVSAVLDPDAEDEHTTLLVSAEATVSVRPAPPPAPLEEGELWEAPIPPPALRDAGLGLWRFRPTPLFAPGPQRAELHEAFRVVLETGQPQAVGLFGAYGTGRTRLARWICEALAERCGVAVWFVPSGVAPAEHVLETTLGPRERALDMLTVRGLDGRAARDAVARWIGEPTTRHATAAAAAVIQALARQRPAVLAIDDAHQGEDLTGELLAGPDVPVLLVLVGADPPKGALPLHRLDPLPPEPMAQLLGELLPLDAVAVASIAKASGGRPGRAIELLHRSWEQARWTVGPTGISIDLEGSERAELPVLAPETRAVLERIAARGLRPALAAACIAWGDPSAASTAVQRAVWLELVAIEDGCVVFAPGVRRAILEDCEDLASHHRAWVQHLPISLDRAWHRMQAGELDEGLAELAAVLEDPETRVGLAVVVAHAERALALWHERGRSPAPGPWATVTLWRAEGRLSLGDGLATLEQDLALAHSRGLSTLEARLRLLRAEHLGEDDQATLLAIHDLVAGPNADPGARAIVERALRLAAGRAGNWGAWEHWLIRCRETARHSAAPRIIDLLHELEADAAAFEGDWLEAYAHIRRCEDLHPGYTDTRCALFALAAGELDDALRHAHRGVERSAARQDRRHLPWALLADALVYALHRDPASARRRLEEARRSTAEHAGRWGEDDRRFDLAEIAVSVAEGDAERALVALECLQMPHNPSPQHHAVLTWVARQVSGTELAERAEAARRRIPGRASM